MASPLGSLLLSEWIREGIVNTIIRSAKAEAATRTKLAKSLLGDLLAPSQHPSFHIWVERSTEETLHAASYARHHGVITTPWSAPIVDSNLISGLRLAIGAPETIEDLGFALQIVADAFHPHREDVSSII
jgi:hypothetical protein